MMGYDLAILTAYGLTCVGIGATIAVWRSNNWRADFYKCCEQLAKARREVAHWRSEANIHATRINELRGKVPQRDPKTNRFVKRTAANG